MGMEERMSKRTKGMWAMDFRRRWAAKFGATSIVVAAVWIMAVTASAWAEEGPERSAVETPALEYPEAVEGEANHPALEEAIERLLADPELQKTTIGIHVEDLSSGEVLYTRQADRPMNPASNIKLVTAAAVLEHLGPNHTFSTELSTNQFDQGRVGDLYIKGEGEAFLLFRDVLNWAAELRMQGVEAIDGDVVIDDGAFDEAYLPPGFDIRPSDAAWRSPIGAVSVNFNAVTVTVTPADTIGQAPTIRLDPPNDYVRVVNRASTSPGALPRIRVTAEADEDRTEVVVSGTIGVGVDSISQRKRIEHPPAFAGAVVARALELVGIEFTGQVRRGMAPESGVELMTHDSKPVMYALSAMNKWSNNFIAEQLLRVLGGLDEAPSTWERARLRVGDTLRGYGFVDGTFQLNNGSGLYDGNELSPRQFVQLLRVMNAHRYGPEFMSTLAIAGVDGTLKDRLDGEATSGILRGKTGTLRDVSALSGVTHTASGRRVAFSILFNDPPRRAWNYRDEQDDIARAIAGFDG